MSTQRTDNDAKRFGGYLKEKWTIGISRISSDELQRAVIKVTSHKLKIPNEKHLERLISATHGNVNTGSNQYDDIPGWIVSELEGHTHSRNWVVVLKTLIVYHHLMNQGSDSVLQKIAGHRQPFNTSHMKDLADSPDGAVQEGFIHAYARYLEERCVTITSCRLQTRIESDEFLQHYLEISPQSAEPITASLLLQLEVMLNVDLREAALNNHATMHAFKLIIDDGKRVYAVLTRRMSAMLEGFVGYPSADKKRWLQLFTRYQQATKTLADLFARMNASSAVDFGERLPTLRPMPDGIVVQLESAMLDDDVAVTTTRLERAPDAADDSKRSKSPELFKKKPARATGSPQPQASPFAISPAQPTPTASPAQQEAPRAAGGSGPLSASATSPAAMQQPKADPFGDLFGGNQPPQAAAPRAAATPPPAPAPAAKPAAPGMDDLFAPAAQPAGGAAPAKSPSPPPTTASPAGAGASDFDPFAPAPASQWQSASPASQQPPQQQQQQQQTGSMDFFATAAPAQQPRGGQGSAQQPPAKKTAADDQLDFFAASSAKPAGNAGGKPRAW